MKEVEKMLTISQKDIQRLEIM